MRLQSLEDGELVDLIRRGQSEALAEAYRRHSGAVFGLALRLVRHRSLAEDVSQEVFVRLWRRATTYDASRGSLRSFLLAHTHGRSIDLIRSEGSRRTREEREARLTAVSGPTVEEEVIDVTRAEHVREALDVLGEGERQAIELAYFGGYSYRQVAEILDVPEGTIKSRIRTGLKRMHGQLATAGLASAVTEETP